MTSIEKLLDKAVKHCSRPSYNALAERTGLSRQTISQFKTGVVPVPEERIAEFARIAGEDPAAWLLLIKSEQTTGEAGKVWARLARQFGAAAALAFVSLAVAPYSQASVMHEKVGADSPSMHIM